MLTTEAEGQLRFDSSWAVSRARALRHGPICGMLLSEGDPMMTDAKLGPKMQEWQVEHTNLYLKSGGKEGHVMKRTPPGGYPEMDVYSLMLTTTGRKS